MSSIDELNSLNDNIDVHVELEDDRTFSVLVSTPSNIEWCMQNEGSNYFFGTPAIYVNRLTPESVKEALEAVVAENNGYWLEMYGALQE